MTSQMAERDGSGLSEEQTVWSIDWEGYFNDKCRAFSCKIGVGYMINTFPGLCTLAVYAILHRRKLWFEGDNDGIVVAVIYVFLMASIFTLVVEMDIMKFWCFKLSLTWINCLPKQHKIWPWRSRSIPPLANLMSLPLSLSYFERETPSICVGNFKEQISSYVSTASKLILFQHVHPSGIRNNKNHFIAI